MHFRERCCEFGFVLTICSMPVDNPAVDGSQDLQPLFTLLQDLGQPVTERTLWNKQLHVIFPFTLVTFSSFLLFLRLLQNLQLLP